MELVTLLGKLISVGVAAHQAYGVDGIGSDEVKALQSALSAGDGIAKLWKRGNDTRAGATHLALITRAFGVALGRYWGNSPRLAMQRSRLGQAFDKVFDEERSDHRERIALRLKHAAMAFKDPSKAPAGKDELRTLQALSSSPLKNPYYQALWNEFSRASVPGEQGEWELAIQDAREFERYFRYAYTEALATPLGAEVQRWLLSLAEQAGNALQHALAEDMAAWGKRHVFGNARSQDPGDPLPFLNLDDSYVEPFGRIAEDDRPTAEDAPAVDKQPILALIHEQLKSSRIVVVKADFGHGKSLTARRLARDTARSWLTEGKPSPELSFPVFIKCSRDMKDARYDHDDVVRNALWNQSRDALGQARARKEGMFTSLPTDQAALYIFDGLDEIALNTRRLEDFFKDVEASLGTEQRAVIFTRPGVLPRKLPNVKVIELLPFTDDSQVEDWIQRWNRASGRPPVAMDKVVELGLRELASTPILLFMIALTWAEHGKATEPLDRVQLYEDFFRHIARGKYGEPGKHGDPEEHGTIRDAADKLAKQLQKRQILKDREPIDAMIWLMSRVAWEAHCHVYGPRAENGQPKPLQARHIDHLLEDELDLSDSDTLAAIQIGLLLAMQIDPTGGSPTILFGHQSFREFLVARYWKHQLLALVQTKHKPDRKPIEARLMQERLLQDKDKAFNMLASMLRPLDKDKRDKIRSWAEDYVEDDSLPAGNLRKDRRAVLRESALAVGSVVADQGLDLDEWALRSLWIWFEFHREHLKVYAPRLQSPKANLQRLNLFEANLQQANLEEANLQQADLYGANLLGANLLGANLPKTRLMGANLQQANLQQAILYGATLAGARFQQANLQYANLQYANLLRANLQGANLQGANLQGANLQGANLHAANLQGANLQDVRYDSNTHWPEGFVPPSSAVNIDQK